MGAFTKTFGKGIVQQGALLKPISGITEEDSNFYITEEDSNNIIIMED